MWRSFLVVIAIALLSLNANAQMGQIPSWPPVQHISAATALPLDSIGTTALAGYSCYFQLKATYSGPLCRVQRASDSTQQDITLSGGVANTSALNTFCNGTTCTLVEEYDQSGSGNNCVVQSTPLGPTIFWSVGAYAGKAFNSSSRPCIVNSLSAVTAATIIETGALFPDTTTRNWVSLTDNTNTIYTVEGPTPSQTLSSDRFISGTDHVDTGLSYSSATNLQVTSVISSSLSQTYLNGTASTPDTSSASFSLTNLYVGAFPSGTAFVGNSLDEIIYSTALSSSNVCAVSKADAALWSGVGISTSGYPC